MATTPSRPPTRRGELTLGPAALAVTAPRLLTWTGLVSGVVLLAVPIPSSPYWLVPQAQTPPPRGALVGMLRPPGTQPAATPSASSAAASAARSEARARRAP